MRWSGQTTRYLVLLLPPLTSGCSAAPAQSILGSFFPAWMLCAVIGVAGSVVLRLLLGATGIGTHVPVAPLSYIAVAGAVTLLAWLLWFGH
ncbi:YtcA family lipoprotein [Lichenicola sp.]|uniref:YtcA family lipoprotein n=1 Tax=Lichenicola sp. TaxID=2804529 RepID=UPI003AFFB278